MHIILHLAFVHYHFHSSPEAGTEDNPAGTEDMCMATTPRTYNM